MTQSRRLTIQTTPARPQQALTELVERLIATAPDFTAVPTDECRSARFTAESGDPETLVADLIDALVSLPEEFGGAMVTASVDGVRSLPNLYRVWGVAELSYAGVSHRARFVRHSQPVVRQSGEAWEITVEIAIT